MVLLDPIARVCKELLEKLLPKGMENTDLVQVLSQILWIAGSKHFRDTLIAMPTIASQTILCAQLYGFMRVLVTILPLGTIQTFNITQCPSAHYLRGKLTELEEGFRLCETDRKLASRPSLVLSRGGAGKTNSSNINDPPA